MKVILLQEVDNLGDEGEIVDVKNGYGRNYLIPRGLARMATPGSVKAWKEERRQAARKLAEKQEDAQNLKKQLEATELVVYAKEGEDNRIFGTITAPQIAEKLAAEGFTVDRRKVHMEEDVRMLGVFSATVKLHPDVTAEVKFRVEPESARAEAE